MKKQKKVIIIVISSLILIVILGLFYFWLQPVKKAQKQISNFEAYQSDAQEIAKLKTNEKDFIYYYAADGKRYVFPDLSVYKSWFGDYPADKIAFESVESMYNSTLGGNVTLRPGSLLQSPTLLETFIVVKNGLIRPVADEKLLVKYYGEDWQKFIIKLPDYYFSQYTLGKPIKAADDFPIIPKQITIDQDKDFIK
jgi:hypothetical protein